MCKMISMSQILELVDKMYGYCQDVDMIQIMKSSDIPEYYSHLVDRRSMLRFFEYYANQHGVSDYLTVIGNNNISGRGAMYYYNDIVKVIKDPLIETRINELLEKKTQPGPFGPVPKCIFHEYIEAVIGDGGVSEADLLQITGMTQRQLDLMSVPNELLADRSNDICEEIRILDQKIRDLQQEKAELELEQEDIDNELNSR